MSEAWGLYVWEPQRSGAVRSTGGSRSYAERIVQRSSGIDRWEYAERIVQRSSEHALAARGLHRRGRHRPRHAHLRRVLHRLRARAGDAGGRTIVIRTDYFAEHALFLDTQHSYAARAMTHVDAYSLERARFEGTMLQFPSAAMHLTHLADVIATTRSKETPAEKHDS